MFDLSAMVMADNATRDHVGSARPRARMRHERPRRQHGDARRQHGDALRRRTVSALRRLADRLEPRRATTRVAAS
jgi:hypothetical protein